MSTKKHEELTNKLLKGDLLSLSRLITLVENRTEDTSQIMAKIYKYSGKAHIIGITGPPGSGKSTITDKLMYIARKEGKKIAVLCVDPSSPFSGGAILGDRIRMQSHTDDPKVFIRSIGTRGSQGGLSHATQEIIILLDAAGFDLIILETAGVGQTELGVLGVAQTTLVVLVPESGDDIQMMKAGILEIAEILIVNKCDRIGADLIVKDLQMSVHLSQQEKMQEEYWETPVVKTSAQNNQGLDALYESIHKHKEFLISSGNISSKKSYFAEQSILNINVDILSKKLKSKLQTKEGKRILNEVANRKLDPFSAVKQLH